MGDESETEDAKDSRGEEDTKETKEEEDPDPPEDKEEDSQQAGQPEPSVAPAEEDQANPEETKTAAGKDSDIQDSPGDSTGWAELEVSYSSTPPGKDKEAEQTVEESKREEEEERGKNDPTRTGVDPPTPVTEWIGPAFPLLTINNKITWELLTLNVIMVLNIIENLIWSNLCWRYGSN